MLGLFHSIHTTYHKHAKNVARQHPSPSAVQVRQLVVAHDESCAETPPPHCKQRCPVPCMPSPPPSAAPAVPVFHGPQNTGGPRASGAGLSRPAGGLWRGRRCLAWLPSFPAQRQRCRSSTARRLLGVRPCPRHLGGPSATLAHSAQLQRRLRRCSGGTGLHALQASP